MSGWTEHDITTLRAMWGKRRAEAIAEGLGKSRNAVIGKANRLGLARLQKNVEIESSAQSIIEKYQAGVTMRRIAEELGSCQSGVWRLLVRHGIATRSHTEAAKLMWEKRRLDKLSGLAPHVRGNNGTATGVDR